MSFIVKPSKGNNRHSLDIVRDILFAASVKARKTRIMYQANLSFTQVKKYLQSLLENGLVRHDGITYYLITEKGLDFLRLYDEYTQHRKLIQDQIDQSAREKLLLESMCSNGKCNDNLKAIRKTL